MPPPSLVLPLRLFILHKWIASVALEMPSKYAGSLSTRSLHFVLSYVYLNQ